MFNFCNADHDTVSRSVTMLSLDIDRESINPGSGNEIMSEEALGTKLRGAHAYNLH